MLVVGGIFAAVMPLVADEWYDWNTGYAWTYSVNGNMAKITAVSTEAEGSVTVPSMVDGYLVTSIGSYAFRDCIDITSVTIPEGVVSLDGYLFDGCENLVSVSIPSTVTDISPSSRGNPFEGTADITLSVDRGNPTFHVSSGQLVSSDGCLVAAIRVSGGVVIPSDVTRIGTNAFRSISDLASLTSLTIPAHVTDVEFYAFSGCRGLRRVIFDEPSVGKPGLQYLGNYAFAYWCTSLTSVLLPSTVTNIDEYAFWNCSSLTTITIPASVTHMGIYVFDECSALQSIIFEGDAPTVDRTMGGYIIESGMSSSLTAYVRKGSKGWDTADPLSAELPSDHKWRRIPVAWVNPSATVDSWGWVTRYNVTTSGNATWFATNGVYRTGLVSQGQNAACSMRVNGAGILSFDVKFYRYESSPSLTLNVDGKPIGYPINYYHDGKWYHYDCVVSGDGEHVIQWSYRRDNSGSGEVGLQNVNWLPKSEIEDPTYAWTTTNNANGTVTITGVSPTPQFDIEVPSRLNGRTVTMLGDRLFYDARMLSSVTVPDGVTSIGSYAFYGCRGLTSIFFNGNVPSSVGSGAFNVYPSTNLTIYVSRESTGWGVEIPGTWQGVSIAYLPWWLGLDLTPGGNVGWAWSDSDDAYRSGAISDYQSSTLTLKVQGAGQLSFKWKVSSESGYDKLSVTGDGSSLASAISGSTSWATVTKTFTSAGTHTVVWTYSKDSSASSGSDCGWVTDVVWTPHHVVTFDANGGSVSPSSRTVAGDVAVGSLPTPTRAGHDFLGWYTALTGGSRVTASTVVTADVRYYAHWQIKTYQVTFDLGGHGTRTGGGALSQTVTYQSAAAEPEVEAALGWVFTGWDTSFTSVTGEMTVHALYERAPLTIAEAAGGDLAFTTGGAAEWFAEWSEAAHDGRHHVRSGAIGNKQSSDLSAVVQGAGTVSFWCRVSSEADEDDVYDGLSFLVDGMALTPKLIGGETGWTNLTFEITGAGSHTLCWRYSKDKSDSAGSDCAWLDEVTWTPSAEAGLAAWLKERNLTADETAANGRTAAECYVLGLDPALATNDFRIVSIEMVDGKPKVEWEPKTNRWTGAGLNATLKGAATLDDKFMPVTEQNKASFRFFKVSVALP